jgi:hypothetical protein
MNMLLHSDESSYPPGETYFLLLLCPGVFDEPTIVMEVHALSSVTHHECASTFARTCGHSTARCQSVARAHACVPLERTQDTRQHPCCAGSNRACS